MEARSLGAANVFQAVLVADESSVFDNLHLGSDNLFATTLRREENVAKVAKLTHELLGFEFDLDISTGEPPLSIKRWITNGRSLLADPKVLILDES